MDVYWEEDRQSAKKEEGTSNVRLRVNYEVFVDCPDKFQSVVEQRFRYFIGFFVGFSVSFE